MNIIYTLIPLGLVLLAGAIYFFFWAVKSGQYDDLESPAWKIILDDDSKPPTAASSSKQADTTTETASENEAGNKD